MTRSPILDIVRPLTNIALCSIAVKHYVDRRPAPFGLTLGRIDSVDPPRVLARLVAGSVVLAALLNCGWVAEFVLRTGLNPVRALVSELEADRTPHAWLYRGMFTTADLIVLVAGVLMAFALADRAHGTSPNGTVGPAEPAARRLRWAWIMLAGYGLLASFEDASPMSCAPSRDRGCTADELVRQTHWEDRVHSFASILGVLAVLGSMLAVAGAGRVIGRRWIVRTGIGFLAAEIAVTATLGLAILTDAPMGIPGRIELVVESGWMVAIGLVTLHFPAGASRNTRKSRPARSFSI